MAFEISSLFSHDVSAFPGDHWNASVPSELVGQIDVARSNICRPVGWDVRLSFPSIPSLGTAV